MLLHILKRVFFCVLAGDFNCTLDPKMDQNPPPKNSVSRMREAIKGMCSDLHLVDIWRTLHPGEKDYIFYSNPHNSFCCVDYFLVSREVLDRVSVCDIGMRILSDHADVHLNISLPQAHATPRNWRLNPSLLNNSMFWTFIKEQVELFLRTNDNENTNPSTLWETMKAYLRGVIISYCIAKKKESLKQQLDLEKNLQT